MMHRRTVLGTMGSAALLSTLPAFAQQSWPSKPFRMIAPFPPGSPGDDTCRRMAQVLFEKFGQPVVVDNRPGASGIIGATLLAQSPPDGYTMMGAVNNFLINNIARPKLPYKPSDIVPLAGILGSPSTMMVDPKLGIGSLKALQEYGKSNKDGLFFATNGPGSTSHFVGEMIKSALGIPLTFVQYKGGAESLAALLGGQVQMISEAPSQNVIPHVLAGKLQAIAVAGEHRIPRLPDVPTSREAGFPSIQLSHWLGFFAPKGTPAKFMDAISDAWQASLKTPELQQFLLSKNAEPVGGPRRDFEKFVASENARLGAIVRRLNISLD